MNIDLTYININNVKEDIPITGFAKRGFFKVIRFKFIVRVTKNTNHIDLFLEKRNTKPVLLSDTIFLDQTTNKFHGFVEIEIHLIYL